MSIWIATINALDEKNAPVTIRFSDGAYVDTDWNYYEPRMAQPALVKVSPDDGGVFHIFSSPSIGEIELNNVDGELNYLADYALDNGNCTLSLVREDGTIIDYMFGKITTSHCNNSKVFLTVNSLGEVLARQHPFDKFKGDNVLPLGVEGIATDIKGNPKPKVFGSVKNATPVLVNTAKLIYQFSSRDDCTVTAVYDKGAFLTASTAVFANVNELVSATATQIPAGYFGRYKGYVRLGATPVGTITGDASSSSSSAGDVIQGILAEAGIVFNEGSKTALNPVGEIGIYAKGDETTASLLGRVVSSIGAYWYFVGDIVYASLIAFATTPAFELTVSEIIGIERTATGIGTNGVPISACNIQYGKIETVQQESDLAGVVTAERKAFLSQEYRNTFAFDSSVIARHALAEPIKIDSVLLNEADANAVATRLLNMFKTRTDIVNITAVVAEIPALKIGDGVEVFTERLGYENGKLLTIVGYEVDAKRKRIVLECIG